MSDEATRWAARVKLLERRLGIISATAEGLVGEPFQDIVRAQREWSLATFGPGDRTAGTLEHIRRELREIEADPTDLEEWVDVILLALDGAWRATDASHDTIANAVIAKQAKNRARTWPKPGTVPADQPVEHVRGDE